MVTQLRKAYLLLKDNNLEAAQALYHTILEQSPHETEALHALGIIAAHQKKELEALNYFFKALQEDPKDFSIYNHIGNVYRRQQEEAKACHYYQKAIDIHPAYVEAHHNLAQLYAKQENSDLALQHYQKALNLAPDSISLHFHLGLLFLKNHQYDYAKIQFQNVLALDANHSEAQFHLGTLALNQDDLTVAEQYFQSVLTEHPEHSYALNNAGIIALKREQNQLAINLFTKALQFNPEDEAIRNNLAAVFMHHDRYENAWVHYEQLLIKSPHCLEYLYNGGVAQMILGALDKATKLFLHLLDQHPHHVAALTNLAAIYKRNNETACSLEYLERALKLSPQDPSLQFMYHAFNGGSKTEQGCPTYVKHLFNNYALYYDSHLQRNLRYTIPAAIAKQLHCIQPLAHHQTLDLGCGTGLTGIVLREASDYLIGVDISAKMLNQAKNKGIYDNLVESEIIEFLKQETRKYSLIVAGDVLPYLGDLEICFKEIKTRLNSGGLLIFTIEDGAEYPYTLQPTARFTHHPNYIALLCQQVGFEIQEKGSSIGRYQDAEPVSVLTYTVKNL